ncbi:acetyltransferase-like isoleucine patch superfamily enzyme [Mycolicibacterium iranicum]|uniref:Acetyltransferase-like isoleucine patch superfamily enzyme n=1 Tax=Mycolicibacterium iranicum TaxID=912594 RepID=A0A839Q707_MYCIR|nr:acyltransferase [Mycolicibacterium iranicum]MBB2991283.1 acetyltransferase-like isoleucine patch superfamily enzyme [Mycolicibacterium iranicum]
MNLGNLRAALARQRFSELGVDRWRADTGALKSDEVASLRRRERLFRALVLIKGAVRLPLTISRSIRMLAELLADVERLHAAPRRKMKAGRGCVLDRQTWLVNGSRIKLGNHVKVSAFSALIAGFEAEITIGDYTILGPGVFVVAANHGIASNGVPIRYQAWKERPVAIGNDVWIGANAVVLPGTQIGDGAVVGAGTVVSGHIPPGVIVYGDRGELKMRERK